MSTQVHTVNFLQRVFRSAVNNNQIFPLDIVNIINNDRIEMENRMYNKKYNIINMFNKYYECLYYTNFDDFTEILNSEYIKHLLSNNNRKNYEPVFKSLNSELIIFYLERIEKEAKDYVFYDCESYIIEIIKLFSNVLEQNDEYNRLVLMYENGGVIPNENQDEENQDEENHGCR
jgi:hypothetical protein